MQNILLEERKLDLPFFVFTARTYFINKRSFYLLRKKNPLFLFLGCSLKNELIRDKNDENSDPEGPKSLKSINTPSKRKSTSKKKRKNKRQSI